MSETENRDREKSLYLSKGDEEIDAAMIRVRHALLSLPKVSCPAGFEYRLNRRLQGTADAQPRAVGRSWVSGWLGVGLGFACAAAVALFMLGLNDTSQTTAPMAGKTQQVAPRQTREPVMEQVTQTKVPGSQTVSPPENAMAASDSVPLKSDPTHISSDRLHQVSGEENVPANR